MALVSTNKGSGARNTGGESTYDFSPSEILPVGSTVIIAIACDNAAAAGTNPLSSISDSVGGNTWSRVQERNNTPGGVANDGVSVTIYICTIATQITLSDTITATFSTTTVARSYTITQVSSNNGGTIKQVRRFGGASGASTTPSFVTTENIYTGDLVFAVVGAEYGDGTITADSDTTNGSWSTAQTANVGTTTSGVEICSQTKVVTGIGDQTYNLTITSADWAECMFVLTDTTFIIPSILTNGGSDTDAASYSTASITPSANKTIIAAILVYDAGAAAATTISVSGNGLTWTRVADPGSTTVQLSVFRASSQSAPSSEAVTFSNVVSAGTADGAVWVVFEIDNVDITTNDGVVQSNGQTTTADSNTITLLPFASADNGTVGVWGAYDNAGGALAFTIGTGFSGKSEQSQTAGGDTLRNFYEYKQGNNTGVDVSVSAANDRLSGVAMEIASIHKYTRSINKLRPAPFKPGLAR